MGTTLQATNIWPAPASASGDQLHVISFVVNYPDGQRSGVALLRPGGLSGPGARPSGYTDYAMQGHTTAAQFDAAMAAGGVFYLMSAAGTPSAAATLMAPGGLAGIGPALGAGWMLLERPAASANADEQAAFTWGVAQLAATMQKGAAATVAAGGGTPLPVNQTTPGPVQPPQAPPVVVVAPVRWPYYVAGLAVVGIGAYVLLD
jgi:hypothetical protein